MTMVYLGLMTILLFIGGGMLFADDAKKKRAAVVILILGGLFLVAAIQRTQTEIKREAAREERLADAQELDDLGYEVEDDDASESEADLSESIAASESVAASESEQSAAIAASVAESSRIAESSRVAESDRAVEYSHQQAAAYSDPRPAQATPNRSYAYAPVPTTGAEETVYVSAAIPGRYHKDPSCRGLQRYGGAQALTLSQAQSQGYPAFCAYERYG